MEDVHPQTADLAVSSVTAARSSPPIPTDLPPLSPMASREKALTLMRHILLGTIARWDERSGHVVLPPELRQLLDEDLLLVLPYLLQWIHRIKKSSPERSDLIAQLGTIFQEQGKIRGAFLRQQIYLLTRASQVPISGGVALDFKDFFADDSYRGNVVLAPSVWETARDAILKNQDKPDFEFEVLTPGRLMNPLTSFGGSSPLNKIKIKSKFGSANAPVLIELSYADQSLNPYKAILKSNDVVARDYFVQNMFRLMNALWRDAYGGVILRRGLLPEAATYRIALLGQTNDQLKCDGLLEYVQGCDLLDRENTHIDAAFAQFDEECWDTFIQTLAGGAVAGYLLGVADRHYENMRLAFDPTTGKACRFLHIDFGFVFGKRPFVDADLLALPVKILEQLRRKTPDDPEGTRRWDRFVELSARAFIVLRKNSSMLLDYASAVFSNLEDPTEIQSSMVELFKLDREETDAVASFVRRLESQPLSLKTFSKRISHEITPGWRRLKSCQHKGILSSIKWRSLGQVTWQFLTMWTTFVGIVAFFLVFSIVFLV